MTYSISVIIRTINESKYLGRVLQRLKEQQYDGPVEIILVDSGSTDETVPIAESFGCRVILIKPEEFSFGRALNVGIENSSGEIIINLSGHSVPEGKDYFSLMVKPFADKDVAAAFGRDIPWPETCPSQARDIYNHFPEIGPDGNKFSNANAAMRRSVWEKIKFDEDIPAVEDLLWARQVMASGYLIKYIPSARVFHSHTPSPKYIRKRAYVESKSLNSFATTKHYFGLIPFVKFLVGHIAKDTLFAIRHRYPFYWLLHIPLYRFSQCLGFSKGYKEASHIYIDIFSGIGRYSFDPVKTGDGKKVLLVSQSFFPESVGGTEYYTLNLARKLAEKGWDVKVVSGMRDLTQQRYKVTEINYEGLKVIKINNPPEFCTKFIEYFMDHTIDHIFEKIVRAERPDIIHFQHTAYLSSRLPEIAHQLKVKSVFTLHDYWYMCNRSQLLRPSEGICPGPSGGIYCATCYDPAYPSQTGTPKFPLLNRMLQTRPLRRLNIKAWLSPGIKQKLKRFLYKGPVAGNREPREPDMHRPTPELWAILEHSFRLRFMKKQLTFPAFVISPSLHLKKRYEAEGFREITYIPHGFDPQEKIGNPRLNEKLVLAYLGNIAAVKGADILIKELKHVKKRQNVRMLFYGNSLDGVYQNRLETLKKDIPDVDISFRGPYKGSDALREILSGVHVVVFPSVWEENHPLVIKEALLHGVPVISSSLGGAPEAIEDGVNGFIFDPYIEGDLAAKINLLLEKREILERIIIGARETQIETMEAHVEKIVSIYHVAMNRKHQEVVKNEQD
ncbi:MAG: glycosyltransferase [Thermodesulfovibrionales bacterium]